MTKEYLLLLVAGVLIAAGLSVIAAALRRGRRRDEARERVNALLALAGDPGALDAPSEVDDDSWDSPYRDAPMFERPPLADELAPVHAARVLTPAPAPPPRTLAPTPEPAPRPAPRRMPPPAQRYVFTLSDSSGSFAFRPGADR